MARVEDSDFAFRRPVTTDARVAANTFPSGDKSTSDYTWSQERYPERILDTRKPLGPPILTITYPKPAGK